MHLYYEVLQEIYDQNPKLRNWIRDKFKEGLHLIQCNFAAFGDIGLGNLIFAPSLTSSKWERQTFSLSKSEKIKELIRTTSIDYFVNYFLQPSFNAFKDPLKDPLKDPMYFNQGVIRRFLKTNSSLRDTFIRLFQEGATVYNVSSCANSYDHWSEAAIYIRFRLKPINSFQTTDLKEITFKISDIPKWESFEHLEKSLFLNMIKEELEFLRQESHILNVQDKDFEMKSERQELALKWAQWYIAYVDPNANLNERIYHFLNLEPNSRAEKFIKHISRIDAYKTNPENKYSQEELKNADYYATYSFNRRSDQYDSFLLPNQIYDFSFHFFLESNTEEQSSLLEEARKYNRDNFKFLVEDLFKNAKELDITPGEVASLFFEKFIKSSSENTKQEFFHLLSEKDKEKSFSSELVKTAERILGNKVSSLIGIPSSLPEESTKETILNTIQLENKV